MHHRGLPKNSTRGDLDFTTETPNFLGAPLVGGHDARTDLRFSIQSIERIPKNEPITFTPRVSLDAVLRRRHLFSGQKDFQVVELIYSKRILNFLWKQSETLLLRKCVQPNQKQQVDPKYHLAIYLSLARYTHTY